MSKPLTLPHAGEWNVKLTGGLYTLLVRPGGSVEIRPTDRWELPEIRETEQPVPTAARVVAQLEQGQAIARDWSEDPRAGCRLCRACSAFWQAEAGTWRCLTVVPADVAPEDLASYSEQPGARFRVVSE